MGRPRKHNKHLPPRCYQRHGAYYYVHRGEWVRLGARLDDALSAYARIIEKPDQPAVAPITALMARFMVHCEREGLAHNTMRAYRYAEHEIVSAFREFDLPDIRPSDVAIYLDSMGDRPASANIHRAVLKSALKLAVRAGQIDRNPVDEIAPFRQSARSRYITDAEYAAIWQAASPMLRPIIDYAYLTAQRISDVLATRLVQLTDAGIEIDQEKTNKRLLIAWSDDLHAVVTEAKAAQTPRSAVFLFPGRDGSARKYNTVYNAWAAATEKAGVADANIHDIRAKSLTDAKSQGLNPQTLAGHATAAMTIRYLRGRERDRVIGPSFGPSKKTRGLSH